MMIPADVPLQQASAKGGEALADAGLVPEDTLLMRAVRSGSQKALEEFARRTRCIPRMVAALNRRIGRAMDEHEVADVAQEVLVTAWEKSDSFDGKSSLEGWVYRIAFLKVMNRGRKIRNRSVVSLGLEADTIRSEAGESPMIFEDVHLCLEALPESEGAVIRLKHFEGLTFEEIASHTDTSSNTLKTRYYRARMRLEKCLRRGGRTEEEEAS